MIKLSKSLIISLRFFDVISNLAILKNIRLKSNFKILLILNSKEDLNSKDFENFEN